jgi:predicted MFS family arabinose efflux permease
VYVAQGLMGTAFVLAFNGAATLAVDLAPPERVGQAIGIIGAVNTTMNAVSTIVAETIADRHGWAVVFKIGAFAGVGALLLSLLMRETSIEERAEQTVETTARAEGGLRFAPWLPLLIATVLIGAAFTAVFTFHQPYAISLGIKELRVFFIGFTCAAVTSRVVFGGLGDRFGLRRVSCMAAALYSVAALIMVRLDPHRLWIYGAVFGIAHGVLYPTLNALVLGTMPPAWRGRAMAFYNGAFNVGSALSALGWGLVAMRSGYPSVFAGAALAAFAAALILFPGRQRPRGAQADCG